ncbi:nesprin-1-like [Seriola dumerili]|uniref:nesprin-1-like n=1 Tax=Seriola dumerili TaxID=41447 RepID=UPI000BBEE55D|nr:nesprin-1-like [Seriola dumerili]
MLLILMDTLQNLKEKANAYTSKAALGEDSQHVNRQVKEAENEAESVSQAVPAAKGMMERVVSAWETYNKCLTSLQTWLTQNTQSQTQAPAAGTQVLSEAERTCGELQRAASRLEGRLAELDHWSTDALDCYQNLKDKEHRGRSALDSTAKVLISRGSQLENQVITEGRDLQDFVARVQKTSPLQHLSTSGMQDRISEAVSHGQPPVVVRSEVHSKAQSMARSRLEKARVHLHGRIQQAIKLFGGKEISESQAKKKQRALKILQPVILDEFLDAVEGYGAFCSGPQLQDLMLLSDSVRKQWEARELEILEYFYGAQVVSHYLLPQAAIDGAASVEQRAESLRELCETVAPGKSSCLETEQLNKSDEAQDKQTGDTVLPAHRGRQPGGNTPLRATGVSDETHPGSSLRRTQSADSPQQDLSPVAGSVPLHGDILPLRSQDVPTGREEQAAQQRGSGSGKIQKSSLRAPEQRLKARLLNITESNQQAQSHIQAVVRGDTVEAKQEPEWTVIPEAVAPPQEEHPSEQEVLERYRKACLVFKSQLKKNEQHLLEFIPEQVTISTLHNQRKQLQTLKQVTEAQWFKFELQYAHLSHSPHLMTREDRSEVERDWEQLRQEWRGQQMCLQNRMTSLENTADLMESADETTALITQNLDGIIRQSMDISSFNLTDRSLQSDLKEMDDRLQSEVRKITKQSSEEERQHPEATSLHQALHNSVSQLKQLRQQLEKVQSAAQAVDHFLATVREVKAEIPALLAKQDDSRQQNEADWEQERRSWQAEMQQRLQTAADQCESVDSNLKAAGMTLTMDGATVTCQDVVTSLSEHVADVEKKLMRARKRESKDGMNLMGKEQMQRNEELNPTEMRQTKTGDDSPQLGGIQEQEHPSPTGAEEESGLEAQRRRLDGENDTKAQREEEHKAQTWRTRALKELESRLSGLLSELQHIQDASSSGSCDVSQTSEVEDVREETTKAVTERLEQCRVLTELLKRFQSVRGELTGTLQRAESTISEQASYMGKDNLQRFHTKVQERKAELNSLGDGIEEVRSVCRQLHSHLRQIPECTIVPFESEADALMDSWLDISERTDSHLENMHLGLTLWDGVLQLGAEVESWTENKLALFAQSPSFQSEGDIKTLQKEIVAQEKSVQRFQQRTTEIQSLLQSAEPPLELQVAETQMRKKIEQLKELGSEAEDVYRQMVAAKGQITARMAECFNSLQKIQDSLLTLAGSDVAAVLAKLKDLCRQLQTQDEQAESLLEDLRVLTSITSPDSLESLCADGIQLQEKVRNAHDLFSDVEEQTQRNIQDLDRVRTELLSQLVSSLQSSSLQQSALVEESSKLLERSRNFHTNILHGAQEKQCSLSGDLEVFQVLLKSTRSWVGDLRLRVDSPLGERHGLQSPVEQRLHHAQAVVSATTDGAARLEELRVTGNSLSHRLSDGDDLKQEIQETIQRVEEQWRDLQQSVEPYHRVLQTDPEVTSSHLSRRQEVGCKVEELQRQIAQLPTLFPWPGTAERRQACLLARQLLDESKSLQLTLTSLTEQRRDLAERTSDNIWADSSWVELDTYCLSLMAELTALLQEVTDMEKDTLQLVTLKDSITNSSTVEAQASLSQQVSILQNHKRALDSSIRENLALRKKNNNQRDQQVKEEVSCVQTAVKDLAANVGNLCGNLEVLPDISQLRQEWCAIQDFDTRLTELAARVYRLQNTGESSITQDVLPADVTLTVDGVAKDVDSLRSIFLQRKQECAENTANRVRQVVRRLQQWSQTVQAEPSSPSQAALDEETFKAITDAQEQEKPCEDVSVTPKKALTVVLDVQENENIGATRADVPAYSDGAELERCDAKFTEAANTGFPEKKPGLQTTLISPESDKTDLKSLHLASQSKTLKPVTDAQETGKYCEDINASPKKVFTIVLDMEFPLYQPQDMQPRGNVGASSPDPCGTKITERQMQEDMEPERTTLGLSADWGAGETTGGSPASCKHRSTMLDILSEIQSLAERKIRLMRTVQQVLACRYQPAQLDVAAMAKQLEEAEQYRCCVQERVATMKSMSAAWECDPIALKRAEGQWSAALLDASATVQVKAAQLDQVRRYHKQMKMTRVFLEVLAAEKEKMSLNALGSSAVQADKLHALLQTMEQKKSIMEELLHLSGQLSVHLSDAESSGALLAQLGDVQEEWRLLEGGIKRALQHATNSNSQSSLLIKEADQLKAKVEALQKSNFQSNDSKSALEFVCLSTDLKLYNQLYLHLQSQSDALVHFSLGQKEKDEIQCNLQELGSLLNDAKRKLDTSTYSCGGISSTKINKQLQDLIMWAKQAENHISIGKKLALFPEEARIQIVDMKKFQTDIFSQRSKMQAQVEEMKDVAFDMGKEESDEVLKTVEDLYEAIVDSLDHVLVTLKKHLHEREKLLSQLASADAWLAATHATRDPCTHVENVSKADIQELESKLESHKLATVEIQSQLNLVEAMAESWKDMAVGLSPGESRYLVNRLSGLWTELDGLLAHERATSWELEELIHERTSSDEELSTIQASLKQISADLEKQKFPLTQETLSTVVHLKHMLMENQCQVQELQHCHEAKRSTLLYTIGELQDRCKALSLNAFEQDKYLHLRRQMEESRDIAKEQIQRAKDKTISVGERFRLCQTLLVELPLVKTQCQEAGDQLEAIAQDLYPSELNSERERIHCTVETLVSWEHSVTDDIKYLEAKLLLGLRFSSELPALIELFQNTRVELEGARPVDPEEKAIDSALRRYWVIWRNMESGMRVLEALGRKEKINLKNFKELYSLRDAAMQECHLQMESLSQARESLKDYQWAAQGAIAFLHNAEGTFLSAPGGFLDCTEEQRQTRQALKALEDGFQAHICHLVELVPQQPCLSRPKAEQLHIGILTQLLVGRAVLEAQAQLRLESLQSCAARQQSHRSCHEDVRQRLSRSEAGLSECAAAQITSYDKCVAQQKRATLLMEDLRNLAGKIEELRAGCPMQGCGVGKDGELAALWRRWVSLRRGVGVLMAHAEQRQEEWKDITTSIEQCCSFLASLQAEVPDSSTVSFTQEKPLELLAQAEMHQAGLEQEQQALASLEHRLEHALSLSSSQDPMSPGPVGRTLVKIQENVRSLKERNLLLVAAAQAEEKERQQVQEEIGEVEKHMLATIPTLEACSNASKRQELREDLSSQRSKLKSIMHGVESRYEEIPDDISKRLQEVQLSLQRAEEKLMEGSSPGRKLAGRMVELCSGLKKVKASLEQKSPTVSDAQNMLKVFTHVWDELDAWHSRLMILESEVHDLAEEQSDQAHLLMDQLTQPLQLHQNASQMAEHRTAFLSKIPVCLQELQDILYSATCWMEEAQSWLNAPCSFTTARSLQNHASSLQLVLDDSERIRDTLQGFRPVLAEISAVCDISTQEKQLDQNDQQVHKMQRNLLEPLEQLLQAAVVVEVMEAELKTMEKNVPKIRTILSSMDDSNITLTEHLQNRQVILANVQSMQRTLEELEKCKVELHLPQGAEESLLAFSRTGLLLQPLEELEQLTQQQASLLENKIREEEETSKDVGITPVSSNPEERQQLYRSPRRHLVQEAFEVSNSEEEEEEDDESCHSSSSDTLTCSIPEDPEETLNVSDVTSEDIAEMKPLSKVKVTPADSSHPGVKEELYEAARRVLFCLDSWTDLLSTPGGADEDDLHLRLLQQEFFFKQLCILDEFELGQSETFPNLKDAPGLEQCLLGRHLRESPGEKAKVQQASGSLLQGITHLLELGEVGIKERQMSQVHNRSQLQAVLCRPKRLLQVLRSQLAFVQHLFQREPEVFKCQEDERLQLEVRAKALQQQALEQEVVSYRRLQEWTIWEDNCGQLGRVLDESEALISSGEPEGDDEESSVVQHRLDACQQTLVQLDESRAALGLLLDQCKVLQTEPVFAASVGLAGGALELRWRSAFRRTEQEIRRCRDIQDVRARFQTDFTLVSNWLVGANKHLKTWSDLADTTDLNQECVHKSLFKLLDLSMEVEAMSVQRASVSREATQLLHLREADCPGLRAQIAQLEVRWSQLTSEVSRLQEQLHQKLLAGWPPVELLCDLEDWLKKLETRLSQEKETVLKAKDAAQITEVLLHYKSGPQAVGADIQALRSERTMFAETLGALRHQWLHLQRQLESQAVVGRVKGVAAALQELKATRAHAEKEEEHPCDITFWNQAESVSHACEDLSQQMEALRPALQQTVTEWSCFDRDLREVTLHTSRVRCALQHQQAPVFSLKQAEGHAEHLQQLQGNAGKGEALWATVEKSFQSLMKTLHRGAAQALSDQMEGERKRWKDVVQELKDVHVKTGETLSLWQEYSRLSDNCSLHLQQLWLQWEELSTSSPSPVQDTQTMVDSVEKMQVVAEGLQSSVGDVLEASKPLMRQLGPPSANLIQSQTRLLSRDVLLLCQAMSGKKKSLQDDGEEQKRFHTCLQTLEKQTQNIQNKLRAGVNDKDSVKQVLLELSDLFPSLVDVRETSGYLTLNNQERERLHTLSREWIESMTHISDRNRELQAERQGSQTFQEKYKNLMLIKEKLVEESMSKKPLSLSCLQEMLTAHQRLQAEIITGHQLLRSLLSDAVKSMEKETGEKRSELVAQVASVKESWFSAVALACQRRSLVKEQLRQRRIYHHGLKHLWKLLTDVDPLLPPAGPALCTLQRLGSCADEYQCVEEALGLRSTVYNQTLEAGKHLCETMTESECQSRLQSELQAVEEAWKQTSSLLGRRRDLVNATLQKWSQCQDGMTNIMSELDEVKTKMNQQLPERPEKLIQEAELSLQRLASGLRELGTMKTDLSQYITAGDSALLEQQLEQLHGQWEELCMKVSLRRQEIADRLNAWTIFNDKNKEFCDWLTQMENKVCHSGDLSIEEMVEKLKKDCMEEINLFSENKSHLKQLGEQLLLASDEAKQTQVRGSMQEVNQRWHNLFHHIEARVKKLKETLVTVQQLDKNMSNLRSWLSRIEAELSRPITYSVCHHQEIQRRLAEQQELQRDIEQHTEGVASVLNLCDVLLRDEDAAGGTEAESDSLQETSRSLDQRWRAICTMALDRRLRIEETWRLWCKFLDDYSRFEDWLKMAERTAANPNSADVLYTVAKEELKKFEGFQRQVHERLTQLELVNNQYRRLARENRTDRASQLKAMVHEGNRRWDTLHRRAAAILRRLKYFTSQREEFEGTRESMLVWLTELDLQLTNVEHFSESDVHHKIQQLNSFQKEISLNTERIDGLIVFGEGLIQRSSPQDAALIEDELQELHTYCQEVFSRLVRFHQRLSQPPIKEEPELSGTTFSLESSLELIGRPWLGRTQGSLPATPTHLLASPLERSGRETPVSVDSLPLEWDHTGDVGGSSTHEDDEEEEERDEEGAYFSALSEVEFTESQEDFIEAPEALLSSSLVPSRSMVGHESPGWGSPTDTQPLQLHSEAAPTLTSTPIKQGYLGLMTQCSGSIKDIKRVSLILDDEEQPRELGLTGLSASDKQSGVIERWELLQAQSRSDQQASPQEPQQLTSDLDDITSWLENVIPELDRLQPSNPAASIEDMEARAKELKEMQRVFTRYKSIMLSVNLRAQEAPDLQQRLASMNRDWSRACTGLQQWDTSLRNTLMRCQEFHETLHSLLLWLAHAESRRYTVDISHPDTPVRALRQQRNTLTDLQEELRSRQAQQASLQALWSQLQPEDGAEEIDEAQEKLHVTGNRMKLLLREVNQDLSTLQQRLGCETESDDQGRSASADASEEAARSKKGSSTQRERRDSSPPRSFFYRVLRAAFPLHLLLLLLLLLPCLIPMSESDPSCTVANNFARSFYPMLRYTNGPPPT